MIALWLAGCAMRHTVRYEPVAFELPPLEQALRDELVPILQGDLVSGRLSSVALGPTPPGAEPVPLSVDELHQIPDEGLYGLFATVRPWARGGEFDLLVDVGDGSRAVTVQLGLDRAAVVWVGGDGPAPVPPPQGLDVAGWCAELAATYGLAEVGSGDLPWITEELGDVALALGRLSDAERKAVQGLALRRGSVSARMPARELAYFDPRSDPPLLEFFDRSFEEGQGGFVGPMIDAPVRAGAMTVLHEIGHALADRPLREAYDDYVALFDAWQDGTAEVERAEVKAVWKAYRKMGRDGPVIGAWQVFRDGRLGPSSYGFRNAHESFAEAFALHHLDPDALERSLPGARAWFEAGHHVDAAGLDP